jgi:hypothetical protein
LGDAPNDPGYMLDRRSDIYIAAVFYRYSDTEVLGPQRSIASRHGQTEGAVSNKHLSNQSVPYRLLDYDM